MNKNNLVNMMRSTTCLGKNYGLEYLPNKRQKKAELWVQLSSSNMFAFSRNTGLAKMFVQVSTQDATGKKQTMFCSTQYTKYQILTEVFSSVQWLSHVHLFATPWTAACQVSLSITNFQSLCKLMSIKSMMPSNHLILYHPLLLLPLIFPSIRVLHTKEKKTKKIPTLRELSLPVKSGTTKTM